MRSLSNQEASDDLFILKQQLETIHPGLYTYTSKEIIDSLFYALKADVDKGIDNIDFFRRVMFLIQNIRNNHTKVYAPGDITTYLLNEANRFPFQCYNYEDSLWVLSDNSNEQLIPVGSRIVKINGQETHDLLSTIVKHLPTDGYNESYPKFAAGYAFSRYYAYFFGLPDSFQIQFLTPQNTLETIAISAITLNQIKKNQHHNSVTPFLLGDPLSFELLDSVGVLTIRSFQIEGIRQYLKYTRTLKKCFRNLRRNHINSLVIDVRENGGGFPEAAHKLLSYLIDQKIYPCKREFALVDEIPEPSLYEREMFVKHFRSHKKSSVQGGYIIEGCESTKVKPKRKPFKGNIYVLMDSRCASATTEFLGQLKTHTDAIFIGEEPGGNSHTQVASDLPVLVLPHSNVGIQVPLIQSVSNTNWENTGRGVIPDILMPTPVSDYFESTNSVLDATIQMIMKD